MKFIVPFLCIAAVACSNTPAPQAPTASSAAVAVSRPDATKAVKHLKEHVSYPTSRSALLAACADTPEFTASEKKWFADNLPDRTFASADDVATALHL